MPFFTKNFNPPEEGKTRVVAAHEGIYGLAKKKETLIFYTDFVYDGVNDGYFGERHYETSLSG
nr:hypothetical protein [Desulfobacula sp.]